MALLPQNLGYGKVIGRFFQVVGDTADADTTPDSVPITGTVVFKPLPDWITALGTEPASFVPRSITCQVNSEGYLLGPQGDTGVWLLASDGADITPKGWTYSVTITLENSAVKTFNIQILKDQVYDLALLANVPESAGTGTSITLLVTQATTARDEAEAARDAAQAVGNTNDTIMASRINDPASATKAALSAAIGTEIGTEGTPAEAAVAALAKKQAGGPRMIYSQVAKRDDHVNFHNNATSSFVTFEDVAHTFDNAYKVTGPLYALEDHAVNATTQKLYRSLDGGITWDLHYTLTIDEAAGTWYEFVFVAQGDQTIYLFKVTNAKAAANLRQNYVESRGVANTATVIGTLDIGKARWISSAHGMDQGPSKDLTQNVAMVAEYGDSGLAVVRVWRTTNRGATWTAVVTKTGNNGTPGAGEVAHFHNIQQDPFTKDWWYSAGDSDAQSHIARSTDNGLTWTTLYSGSQRERTCSFVFTPTHVYYGMDSAQKTLTHSKIVKIAKSDLSREDVATVYAGRAVYSLTRTWTPNGFLVWSQSEGASNSVYTGEERVQWFDLRTETLHDVASFPTVGYSTALYHGFQSASRYQDVVNGTIYARPSISLGQGRTDAWASTWLVSRVGRAHLSMGI